MTSDFSLNDKVRRGYNQVAQRYFVQYKDRFKNEKHLNALVKRLSPKARTILDVGCGAGIPIDSYLVKRGLDVVGIDISEEQIKLARRNVPQASYQVMDMSQLTKGQFAVDAVVSFYAIFHTPRERHEHVLSVLRSFLQSGGLLLITMGANEWDGRETNFLGTEMYWSHYGVEKNKQLVEQAGFRLIWAKVDPAGGEKHLVILAEAV